MKKYLFVFAACFALFINALDASAGEPRLVASHGDWDAYVFIENGNKVCYMASKPKKEEGKYSRRGDIYALITHRPSEGTKDVFSYITGYTYKRGSEATIDIDGKKYSLFTQDDTAWAPDAETDKTLAKAMQAGSRMIIRGTSTRGTLTKDTFSLNGSTKAYERISKECSS